MISKRAPLTSVEIKHPNAGTSIIFTDVNGEIELENLLLGINNFPTLLRVRVFSSALPDYQGLDDVIIFGPCQHWEKEWFLGRPKPVTDPRS